MNMRLLRLCFRSLKRRWRQASKVSVTVFIALFFITGVLLFQENMYQWQMAANKERFGDWFLMEKTEGGPSRDLTGHPYLQDPALAEETLEIYDQNWEASGLFLGWMSEDFIRRGHIEVEKGKMPESDNEIAVEWNTLAELGYTPDLGSVITIRYLNGYGEDDKKEQEYVLTGILRNYTTLWQSGKAVPGAVITEHAHKSYKMGRSNIYLYPLKNMVKTDDYKTVYDNIAKSLSAGASYNENVYDFKPWGPQFIYDYMYLIVMLIGIAAIAYQIIMYWNQRRYFNGRLELLGASAGQIKFISFFENMFLIIPFGILGIAAASGAGMGICTVIENRMSVIFYQVNENIYVRSALSLLAAVATEEIISIYTALRGTKNAVVKKRPEKIKDKQFRRPHRALSAGNLNRQVQRRLSKSSGTVQAVSVRLFSFCAFLVVIFCIYNIYTAFSAYGDNDKRPDLTCFKQEKDDYLYCISSFNTIGGLIHNPEGVSDRELNLSREELFENNDADALMDPQKHVKIGSDQYGGVMYVYQDSPRYMKNGNTNIMRGLTEDFLKNVRSIPGIRDITFSNYETERIWRWDGQSADKMGKERLFRGRKNNEGKKEDYGDRYIFATEYVQPSKELYKRLLPYMDKKLADYDSFCSGEQVVVFINDNPDGDYDDSIKPGDKIDYMYYNVPIGESLVNDIFLSKTYSTPYQLKFLELAGNRFVNHMVPDWQTGESIEDAIDNAINTLGNWYRVNMEPCVSPTVAGVVRVNREIKEELGDIIIDFGYYTAIASEELGKTACDKQDQLIEEVLGTEIPEDMRCKFTYNQMSVNYDLSSSYSATDNILSTYCKKSNMRYMSLVETKEMFRERALNALLQYGVTILAVIVIELLIKAILVRGRFESRKERFLLLMRLGAGRGRICRICMAESLRESLWCIFTLPLQLVVHFIIYIRAVKRLR